MQPFDDHSFLNSNFSMRYVSCQIVFQEIPEEITLSFLVSGCGLRCQGCHSSDSWQADRGTALDEFEMKRQLGKYDDYISNVLLMGGEWEPALFVRLAKIIKQHGKKVSLYTGRELEDLPRAILDVLDYVKTGPYISSLGALDSETTNQRLYDLSSGKSLNHFFLSKEDENGSSQSVSGI